MLRHRGPEEGMRAAILHLYRDWLPGSGETLREAPFYCRRVGFFPDVPESEAVTEQYLPLA